MMSAKKKPRKKYRPDPMPLLMRFQAAHCVPKRLTETELNGEMATFIASVDVVCRGCATMQDFKNVSRMGNLIEFAHLKMGIQAEGIEHAYADVETVMRNVSHRSVDGTMGLRHEERQALQDALAYLRAVLAEWTDVELYNAVLAVTAEETRLREAGESLKIGKKP